MALALAQADPTGRDMYISLGACSFNIQVAAEHFGLKTITSLHESDQAKTEVVISFGPSEAASPSIGGLFPAIRRRFSDKRILPRGSVAPGDLEQLSELTGRNHLKVSIENDESAITKLSHDYLTAAQRAAASPAFAREMGSWLRGNKTKRGDGMPGFVNGLSAGKALVGKTLVRLAPGILQKMAIKYRDLIATSPAVGLISTDGDTVHDWVAAGEALQQVALEATLRGLNICPLAAMVEDSAGRKQLKEYFPASTNGQIMFRIAVADKQASMHTPRRDPELASDAERSLAKLAGVKLKQVQIGAYNINFATAGSGPALILLHGANIGWGQWYPNISAFADKFSVYAVDLPGCGHSTHVDFRKLEFERDYVNTVLKLIRSQGLTSVSLVGHSFGAAIALRIALSHPTLVNKLVLVNPLGFSKKIAPKQKVVGIYPLIKLVSRTAMKPTYANMRGFLNDGVVNPEAMSEKFVDYYHQLVARSKTSHPLLFMNSLTRGMSFRPEIVLSRELRSVKQPTLIAIGEQDRSIPVAQIYHDSRQIPTVSIEKFQRSGHVPAVDQAPEFNQAVLKFLTENKAS